MKILRGTIFGGIVFFLLGWLVWGILFAGAMESMYNQSIYLPDNDMIWWAMIVSNLVFSLFLTLFLKWSGVTNITGGLRTGAIFGGLFALSVDLGIYSMTNVINSISGVIVDTISYVVLTAIVGLIIVLTWGKEKNVSE